MPKDWYRNGWNRNNLLFTSADKERSLGQGINNCVYTNNRLMYNLKFMQLVWSLPADFKHEPVGGDLPLWRSDTRFHLENGADIFFLCLICALRCRRRLAAQSFWSGKKKNRRTSGTMRYFQIIIYGPLGNWTNSETPNLQEVVKV